MDLTSIVAWSLWLILPLFGLGSLLHFVYDWAGRTRFAAVISAANESYWEHIKIGVWPVALAHLVLFVLGGWRYSAFIPASTIALYTIPIAMIGIVYLYKAFTKRNILWVDIVMFGLVIAIAQVVFVNVLLDLQAGPATIAIAAVFLVGFVTSFLVFTLHPPAEPDYFIDPITKTYGMTTPAPKSQTVDSDENAGP